VSGHGSRAAAPAVPGPAGALLTAAEVDRVFPFHLVLAPDGVITGLGRSLARILPGVTGQRIEKAFACDRAVLDGHPDLLVLLRSRARDGLVRRGQLVPAADGGRIFVGSPQITAPEEMDPLGLRITDFAGHDPVSDFLIISQAMATSLQDATRLADALASANHSLEERVQQRTAKLAEQAAELARINQRLSGEMEARQRAEAELNVSHRMEAVGQLAAGIAHEINTPIQFVGDNLRFLRDAFADLQVATAALAAALPEPPPVVRAALDKADLPYLAKEVPEALQQLLEGVARVSSLVQAMKEFSHPDTGEQKPADLNRAIETTLVVARNEYKYVADVVTALAPGLPPVTCVVGEVNQAVLNLLVNAAHAIGDAKGRGRGTITITTLLDGDHVEIRVADSGTGIPEEIRGRIFDPFFTTKPVGKGTGQGLYLVHTLIVKKHHGTVQFESQVGAGTTFIFRLPVSGRGQQTGHRVAP
jgi:signal transduction histidine kinase